MFRCGAIGAKLAASLHDLRCRGSGGEPLSSVGILREVVHSQRMQAHAQAHSGALALALAVCLSVCLSVGVSVCLHVYACDNDRMCDLNMHVWRVQWYFEGLCDFAMRVWHTVVFAQSGIGNR